MKDMFLNNSVKFITKYNNKYTEYDIEKIKYGLEGLYLTITKLIIIFILAIILNIFKEILLMLLFLNIIRYPAFGVHADKSSICLIISLLLILCFSYFMVNIIIPFNYKVIICIISVIQYFLFAPADTIKRPLTNIKKRKYRKIASCILALIYMIIILTIKNELISNIILTALIVESIMINPVTYMILKMPYNNYKKI